MFIIIFVAISILSSSIAILIKKIDKLYHLYDARILLLPCLFFGLGWACIGWFTTFSLFFSFVVLMISSLAISFGALLIESFGIDIYKRAALSIINYIREALTKWREAQAERLKTKEIQAKEMETLDQLIKNYRKNKDPNDI